VAEDAQKYIVFSSSSRTILRARIARLSAYDPLVVANAELKKPPTELLPMLCRTDVQAKISEISLDGSNRSGSLAAIKRKQPFGYGLLSLVIFE